MIIFGLSSTRTFTDRYTYSQISQSYLPIYVLFNLFHNIILLHSTQSTSDKFNTKCSCFDVVFASVGARVPIEHVTIQPDLPLHIDQIVDLDPLTSLLAVIYSITSRIR